MILIKWHILSSKYKRKIKLCHWLLLGRSKYRKGGQYIVTIFWPRGQNIVGVKISSHTCIKHILQSPKLIFTISELRRQLINTIRAIAMSANCGINQAKKSSNIVIWQMHFQSNVLVCLICWRNMNNCVRDITIQLDSPIYLGEGGGVTAT